MRPCVNLAFRTPLRSTPDPNWRRTARTAAPCHGSHHKSPAKLQWPSNATPVPHVSSTTFRWCSLRRGLVEDKDIDHDPHKVQERPPVSTPQLPQLGRAANEPRTRSGYPTSKASAGPLLRNACLEHPARILNVPARNPCGGQVQ